MIINAKTVEYDALRREMAEQEARCRAEVMALSHDLSEARRQIEVLILQLHELQRNQELRP